MKQEEKQLLLQDLCARLPYGVKVHCVWSMFQGDRVSEDGELVSIKPYSKYISFKRNSGIITEIPFNRIDGTVLPYLRPMSNMTEEEKKEVSLMVNNHKYGDCSRSGIISDYLNSIHVDYRGLIEKGLAIVAPKEMYEIKEKQLW